MDYSIKITKGLLGYEIDAKLPYLGNENKVGLSVVDGLGGFTPIDTIRYLKTHLTGLEEYKIVLDKDSNLGWIESKIFEAALGLDKNKSLEKKVVNICLSDAITEPN